MQKIHTAAIFLYFPLVVSPPNNLNMLVTGQMNSSKFSQFPVDENE